MDIKLTGFAETRKALEALPVAVEKKVLRQSTRAGAKVILAAARSLAPVGKTGRTLANLKIRAGKCRKGAVGYSVGINKKDFAGGKRVFYLPFVLYGHKIGKRPGKWRKRILGDKRKSVPGDNWLANAYEESAAASVDATVAKATELVAKLNTPEAMKT